MKTLFLDLDGTLVDTSSLRLYRRNRYGRSYAARNIDKLETKEYSPLIKEIASFYSKRDKAFIVTNSPLDYAEAILKKHEFPKMPIMANLKKPLHKKLGYLLKEKNVCLEDALLIGDTAGDILSAHGIGISSIGVLWGQDSSNRLEMAEPTKMILDPCELEDEIRLFEREKEVYCPRKLPNDFSFLDKSGYCGPAAKYIKIGEYRSVGLGLNEFSKKILDYKSSKNFTFEEIKNDITHDYFYGEIKRGRKLKRVINYFYSKIKEEVSNRINKDKNQIFIGSPNSFPEFCYRFDVNHFVANALNKEFELDNLERIISRVYPKEESHNRGVRGLSSHLSTMGVKKEYLKKIRRLEEVFIIDDVMTSGCQIKAISDLLHYFGSKLRVISIILGKTI